MDNNDTATEPRWWNEDTTYYEIVRRYAEERGDLTPENLERFVADQGSDETVKRYADRSEQDLDSAYTGACEGLMWSDLEGKFDDYYTVAQLATRALKHLHTRPSDIHTTFHAVRDLEKDLALLSKKCDDDVRAGSLLAAAKAAARITSGELRAVLEALADIELATYHS
jgi:hypothetical protein